jgi:hypothetical protein
MPGSGMRSIAGSRRGLGMRRWSDMITIAMPMRTGTMIVTGGTMTTTVVGIGGSLS